MLKLDLHPQEKALRQFGWIALVGFPLVGWIAWWRFGAPAAVLWTLVGLGVAVALCAALRVTRPIQPVFVLMMLIAIPIGFVITHLLLALVYYGLFTPTAWLFRLRGKDPLQRAWDAGAKTYWHERAGA